MRNFILLDTPVLNITDTLFYKLSLVYEIERQDAHKEPQSIITQFSL